MTEKQLIGSASTFPQLKGGIRDSHNTHDHVRDKERTGTGSCKRSTTTNDQTGTCKVNTSNEREPKKSERR